MKELRYTLLSDGSSDRTLIPILSWLLHQHLGLSIQTAWADLRRLPRPPRRLPERILKSLELYPADLLFVHRDAEAKSRQTRMDEIRQAIGQIPQDNSLPPVICVIPVHMQEAWLLFDEAALRKAAGNPRGRTPLKLPPLKKVEGLPHPEIKLYELLLVASGLSGRQRKKFRSSIRQHARRVPEFISDFSPLRALSAFQALETDIEQRVSDAVWINTLKQA
ncbi:MAG TPA: DUF4276 family protein [Candidatus Fraserbacteria bacterium]|nr:DUF4276 family protein [Candidatus Fraserbacteria bacterium]